MRPQVGQRYRPLHRWNLIRLGSVRMFTLEQIDFDALLVEETEAKAQVWKLGCFDTLEYIPAISDRAPFPFMTKDSIRELFHLLRHPEQDDLSMIHLLSSIAKPTTSIEQGHPCDSTLLRFPAELIHHILDYLNDRDALSLALTNRHLFERACFRVHAILQHRIPGAWVGRRIAVVGEQAYAPVSASYEPQINNYLTRLVVPVKTIAYDDILEEVFKRFSSREPATIITTTTIGRQAVAGSERREISDMVRLEEYPRCIRRMINFLDSYGCRTDGRGGRGELGYNTNGKSYVIRNLSKGRYIRCHGAEKFRHYLRHVRGVKPSLKGTDIMAFTVEEAAICAFAMQVMWGGEGKEGPWACDTFDIVEEVGFDEGAGEWVDVTAEVMEDAINHIRRS